MQTSNTIMESRGRKAEFRLHYLQNWNTKEKKMLLSNKHSYGKIRYKTSEDKFLDKEDAKGMIWCTKIK